MKRSAQVALLLMGVGGVGAGAYAVSSPRNDCVPQGSTKPSAVASNPVGAPGVVNPCPPRRSGSGIGGSRYYSSWSNWSSPIYNRGSTTTTATPSAGRAGSVAFSGGSSGTGVARGGFGGTGHSASAGS